MVVSRTQKESIVAGTGKANEEGGSKWSLRDRQEPYYLGLWSQGDSHLWSAHGLLVCKLLAVIRIRACADVNQLCHIERFLVALIYTYSKSFSMKEGVGSFTLTFWCKFLNFLRTNTFELTMDKLYKEFSVHVNVEWMVRELVGRLWIEFIVIEFTFQSDFCNYRIESGVGRSRRRDQSGSSV